MANWGKSILAFALVLLITACGASPEPSPEGTPAATSTLVRILPTNTPVPPPPTPTPTPVPTAAPTVPAPAVTGEATEASTDTSTDTDSESVELEEPEETRMVTIPAGEFAMGSEKGDESPVHIVSLDAFEIDMFEVTNSEFAQFVEETGYQTDAEKSGDPNPWRAYFQEGRGNYPVVKVSWSDAQAYCQWMDKRLPTEAEWEKAARGDDERIYPWGNEWDVSKVNSKESGLRGPVTTGSFPEGASPYGAKDMAGNVWEWTADWYQGYPQTLFNSNYFGQTFKVLRGGGWFSDQELVRTTQRNANSPDAANDDIGFRCAR